MKQNKPSATAFLITKSTYFLSIDPILGQFIPNLSAKISSWFIEDYAKHPKLIFYLYKKELYRVLLTLFERLTVPGIQLHYALRKQTLEMIARNSIEDNYTQIIILGSGFDSIALRLSEEYPHIRYIEIDHPSTQSLKMKSIEFREKNNDVLFISIDFGTQKLEDHLLSSNQLKPEKNTLIIAEGLFMYLNEEHIKNIFQFVRKNFTNNVRFAFTFMELDDKGRIRFHNSNPLVNLWLRLKGESFTWGLCRSEIEQFLKPLGFTQKEFISHHDLRLRYLNSSLLSHLPLAKGECICISEKM